MAMLLPDDIFKCRKCINVEFEIVNINSFVYSTNKDKSISLLPNTERQVLKCTKCGEIHTLNDSLKLERAD